MPLAFIRPIDGQAFEIYVALLFKFVVAIEAVILEYLQRLLGNGNLGIRL